MITLLIFHKHRRALRSSDSSSNICHDLYTVEMPSAEKDEVSPTIYDQDSYDCRRLWDADGLCVGDGSVMDVRINYERECTWDVNMNTLHVCRFTFIFLIQSERIIFRKKLT